MQKLLEVKYSLVKNYTFKIKNKNKVWNMFTVNYKDTKTTPLNIFRTQNITRTLNILRTLDIFHTLF